MDKRESSISVFVNLSKAIDAADHAIILTKTEKNGIRGLPLNMLTSYLTNGTQQVKIGKCYSDVLSVTKSCSSRLVA